MPAPVIPKAAVMLPLPQSPAIESPRAITQDKPKPPATMPGRTGTEVSAPGAKTGNERVPIRQTMPIAISPAFYQEKSGAPPINMHDAGGKSAVATAPMPHTKAFAPVAIERGELVVYWKEIALASYGRMLLEREFGIKPAAQSALKLLGGTLATYKLKSQAEANRLRTILLARFPDWQVDFNARYHSLAAPAAADTKSARTYFPQKIDLPPGLRLPSEVRIGMVDSAVLPTAALTGARVNARDFLGAPDRPADPGHGTAIATLIAGSLAVQHFAGPGAGAKLYVASIMQEKGGETSTNTAALVRSLDWLASEDVRIINLSLGGPGDEIMAGAIARLLRRNIVIVAAAGNSGPDAAPTYPAAYPGVLAVTASDALDRIFPGANQGRYIGITAPGVDIWVPDAQGGRYVTGTSFSAAIVAGVVALMVARAPHMDAKSVISQLCENARDLGLEGRDPVYGCGLVQVARTLASVAHLPDHRP
ncbi:MAG: S8 family serine peptidase [Betaproteobacteria bacterium]